MEKKIAITGSSGFIGKEAIIYFRNRNYTIRNLSREIVRNNIRLQSIINDSDVVLNLAGSSILTRWNRKNKKNILSSRIETTKQIVMAIENSQTPPTLLISASAIGLYDNDHVHTEDSNKIKSDFIADVVSNWEKEANIKKHNKTRLVILRLGVVLGRNGGIIKKMTRVVKLGIGATIGSGEQAFSYIHVEDVLRALSYVIENKDCKGVYNTITPEPVTNAIFIETMGRKLHKPIFLKIPKWMVYMLLKKGGTILTEGQKAIPGRLIEGGFRFKFPTLNECLNDIFSEQEKK